MNLSWRPLKLTDMDACARLPLLDEAAYDAQTRERLPELWRHLTASGVAETSLLEDEDRPAGKRLMGFAFIVFLTDSFLVDAQARLPPYINRQIVDAWLAGRSPILDVNAIRRANSGKGLNQHTFHQAFPEFVPGVSDIVLGKLMEIFFHLSQGYQLKQSTIEVYGEAQLQMNLNGGYRLQTDYAGRRLDSSGSGDKRPHLIGMTREESRAAAGSSMSLLFRYTPPRFFFKPGEQELLARALWGASDDELAEALNLAVATVRKRWLMIYDRVLAVSPQMFPSEDVPAPPQRTRGTEKRRILLAYLRTHMEELRPINGKP